MVGYIDSLVSVALVTAFGRLLMSGARCGSSLRLKNRVLVTPVN